MTIRACLPGLVEKGELDQSQADEIAATYDGIRQQYDGEMSAAAADAMASKATVDAMEHQLLRRKRLEAGTLLAKSDMLKKMEGFKGGNGGGPIDPKAAEGFFDNVPGAQYSNVEGRRKAIIARSHAMMDGILAKFHSGITGASGHKADLADLVREVFGEDSGNATAKQLAKAWMDASEMLRRRFNQAGGDIGKMDRWGLPQSHDTLAVRKTGFDVWRDFIWDKLDRERMTDADSDRPLTDSQLREALRQTWETIRSDGWNDRNPGGAGRSSLANRRTDPRFLQFKSADDWMAYADEFGSGNAYNSMMGHINGMARDIALMEILGPNPNQGVKWLKDTILKSAETDEAPGSKAVEQARAGGKRIDRLYGEITGAAGEPESRKLALSFSAVRSMQVAAKLGSAFLSAVPTDPMFGVMARKVNGLPAAGIIRDYVKLFGPGLADKQLAIRQGMIAEEWSRRTAGQARALGEELSGELASRLAEGVLRVSGLQRYTQAGRWAFGMEFIGHLTDQRGKDWGQLGNLFRDSLQRYGIDEAGWDKIRATTLENDGGVDWIKPVNVEDRELGDKLMELIHSEMLYAVPEMDLRTRALFNSIAPKGTWAGELARSTLLFKGFGITSLLMQSRRIMELGNRSPWAAINYAGGLVLLTTLGGALALQMKSLAGGSGFRPMAADPLPTQDQFEKISEGKWGDLKSTYGQQFWGAATLQGGGWGIFGDFLQSQQNRFGGGFASTLGGPIVSDAQQIADVWKSKHPAWAAARTARQFLPGGSLWFARTAFDRNVTDQVQEAIDPNYRDSWRRMAKRAQDQRTEMWWRPGERLPDEGPDAGKLLETPPDR
jgi:hypothetical protein